MSAQADRVPGAAPAGRDARRWLLFVHQLPAAKSNLRVSTWRRLQQIGAIPLKQAVYVLPDTPSTREDFEWLKAEVDGAGGDAGVFTADCLDAWHDDALMEEFRRVRQDAYDALAHDLDGALRRSGAAPRARGSRAPAIPRLLDLFRHRLAALEAIDFFGSAGRDRVITLLGQLEERSATKRPRAGAPTGPRAGDVTAYQHRLWITRPRPGVDRMASAWLIRRFIDAHATFAFAASAEGAATGAVAFDMFGGEFSHQGDGCTFETLCSSFAIADAAVSRIAGIVHDLDLKDGRFGAPEAGAVGLLIDGLQLTHQDDHVLLAQGMALFETLYRSFEHANRTTGPRVVARPRKVKSRASGARRRKPR